MRFHQNTALNPIQIAVTLSFFKSKFSVRFYDLERVRMLIQQQKIKIRLKPFSSFFVGLKCL